LTWITKTDDGFVQHRMQRFASMAMIGTVAAAAPEHSGKDNEAQTLRRRRL